jgi:cytochrome c556
MRNFFPALEAVQDEPRPLISLEEEMLLIDENARDEARIQKDLAEVNRGMDLADALEDLAVVAGNVKDASAEETQLTEICGQMAAAGTDIAPEEIVPSMESFKDGVIATENFKETAKKIWESIQKFLAHVWETIVNFFKRIFAQIPRARYRLEELKKQIKSIDKSKSKQKEGSHVGVFAVVAHKDVTDPVQYIQANKAFTSVVDWTYSSYAKYVLAMGEKAKAGIEAFDAEDPQASANKLRYALQGVKLGRLPGVVSTKKVGQFDTQSTDDLLHNKILMVSDFQKEGDVTTLGVLEKLRTHHVQLAESIGGRKMENGTGEVHKGKPLTVDQMEEVVKELEAQLDAIEKFDKSKNEGDFQRVRKDLAAASKKAEKSLSDLDHSETSGHSKVVETYYRAMLAFNAAFCHWINQPLLQMTSLTLTNLRTGIARVQESIKCYDLEHVVQNERHGVPVPEHPLLPA